MALRQKLARLADPLDSFVADRPEAFGGIYYDQGKGSLVANIETTVSTSKEDLAEAMALAPEGLEVNSVPVAHTMSELQAAEDRLVNATEELALRMVGIDTRNNGLVATVAPGSDATAPGLLVDVPVQVTMGDGPQLTSC